MLRTTTLPRWQHERFHSEEIPEPPASTATYSHDAYKLARTVRYVHTVEELAAERHARNLEWMRGMADRIKARI